MSRMTPGQKIAASESGVPMTQRANARGDGHKVPVIRAPKGEEIMRNRRKSIQEGANLKNASREGTKLDSCGKN